MYTVKSFAKGLEYISLKKEIELETMMKELESNLEKYNEAKERYELLCEIEEAFHE